MNLDSFTGIHRDVIVVVLDGERLVPVLINRDRCPFEEGDVFGRVMQINDDMFFAVGRGPFSACLLYTSRCV